jgi:hypothetical protein
MTVVFVLLATSLSLSGTSDSASGHFGWVHGFGDGGYNVGASIDLDSQGNLLSTGRFYGTVDFDPGAAETVLSSERTGLFIGKFHGGSGELIWASGIDAFADVSAMAVDKGDAILVCGYFYQTSDLSPGADVSIRSPVGRDDVFVLKMSTSGQLLWLRTMGGSDDERPTAIDCDEEGNVYITGHFRGIADFDPGVNVYNLEADGYQNAFIVKLSSSGAFLWAKQTDGYYPVTPKAIAAVDGIVYIGGAFSSLNDFHPGPSVYTLVSKGHEDGFLLMLNEEGDFVSARQIGGVSYDSIESLTLTRGGTLMFAGNFNGVADVDPSAGIHQLSSGGGTDVFVALCRADGEFQWAKSVGGPSTDVVYALGVDESDSAYITGTFRGAVDFDPGSEMQNQVSNGIDDIFVLKLSSNGEFAWIRHLGGGNRERPSDIRVGGLEAIYLTGAYGSAQMDFDPTTSVATLDSYPSPENMFLMRIKSDLESPKVIRITPSSLGPGNYNEVSFAVELDEKVRNFEPDDVIVSHSGTLHGGVVLFGGPREYSVIVSDISGDGNFSISVSTTGDIMDFAGNLLESSIMSEPVAIDSSLPGLPALSHPVLLLVCLLLFGLHVRGRIH